MDSFNFEKRTVGKTAVIMGGGLIDELVGYFCHTFQEGALCLVYDRNVTEIAENIAAQLKRAGYRIFMQAVSSKRHGDACLQPVAPEYVRHVFAVGAGTACEYAKRMARALDTEWTLFLTAPSTDTVMHGFAPKTVFIDENVMINCPFECKAAGYGILFSQPLKVFEDFFARKVLAKEQPTVEGVPQGALSESELAFALLEISLNEGSDSAQLMAQVLYNAAVARGRRPRLIGEYKYLASACISSFYTAFLGALSIDAMPPACREIAADKLKSIGCLSNRSKSVDFFDSKGYFKISYILGEYRTDLLDKLSSIDFHTTQRFWRRLYPDAGYWLKGEITCRDLITCLSLTGYLSDSLLGFAYASGVI